MRDRMRRLLCLVLSLTAAVGLMLVRDSAAWFNTESGSPYGQAISVKKMNFEFGGELRSYLRYKPNDTPEFFIITGQNLIDSDRGTLYVVNHSTIKTALRFKVSYTSPVTGAETLYTGTGGILTVTPASGWSFRNLDRYFYYPSTNSFLPANSAQDGTVYDLLTEISFNDQALTTAVANAKNQDENFEMTKTGEIHVLVQARQFDIMEWVDVGKFSLAPPSTP